MLYVWVPLRTYEPMMYANLKPVAQRPKETCCKQCCVRPAPACFFMFHMDFTASCALPKLCNNRPRHTKRNLKPKSLKPKTRTHKGIISGIQALSSALGAPHDCRLSEHNGTEICLWFVQKHLALVKQAWLKIGFKALRLF